MDAAIQYLRHHQINQQVWDRTIAQSPFGLIYANSQLLNAMSPNWEALVMGNYEIVMPLTWRKKFVIRYICQPAFAAQLGVFGLEAVSQEVVDLFFLEASRIFRLIELRLHPYTLISNVKSCHVNYELSLNKPYKTLQLNYNKDLRNNLHRASKYALKYQAAHDVPVAVESYKNLYGYKMGIRPIDYDALVHLAEKWLPNCKAFIREIMVEEKERLAIALFFFDGKRIYNIASSTFPNGRKLNANHFLFDQLIQEFADQPIILDFEGSDLPGIAKFYEKFGAIAQNYAMVAINRLPKWVRLLTGK